MATDPLLIIERQLQLLHAQSEKGPLTSDEILSLNYLVKIGFLVKLKTVKDDGTEEFKDIDSADLKALLPLLTDHE